ncbi:MAG: methionine--tRNA ligase [Candidatus Taylorbacteria bacterium]|nr:methionine--tRNA ligase [Candidatus Taylorbacteria bacterium]
MNLKNKKMKNKFYITTAIIYTNGPPHAGFAFELIQADVLARYHRLLGDDTFFLTGTDEHGSTVVKAAKKSGVEPQIFVDKIAKQVKELTLILNISNDDFIRTSDQKRHWPTAMKIWQLIEQNNDLYKKKYKGLYCVGHESFIKKTDLVDGVCPLHQTEPEEIEEENYFFKLSKYKKEIKIKIESDELKIVPATRKTEILNLIEDAEDVSFSRPKSVLKWGIPVPNDPEQTQYVWTDALTNYLSALGYADNDARFKKYWPADVHLIGKDILRFHALYFPAMLMSVGLELPKSIYVHGFITVEGQKMSKTVGNVIDPFELVKKYGTDVVRYFLLREIPSGEDGDFSYKKLEERYNGDLANGLGNLVQRTITLIENNLTGELIYKPALIEKEVKNKIDELFKEYVKNIDNFLLHEALGRTWDLVGFANKYIDDKKPWAAVKHDEAEFLAIMNNALYILYNIAWMLVPFLPETADKIFTTLGADRDVKTLENYKFRVIKGEGLFPRLEK